MDIIIFYPLFIAACFLAFYIPGRVLLHKTEIPFLGKIVSSIAVGIALWTLQGIIFGYLQVRWMSYGYLLIFLFLFIYLKYYKEFLSRHKFSFDIPALVIGAIGVVGQVIPFVQMGRLETQGLSITAYNSHDHLWHAALVEQLIRNFPPQEPEMSGVMLKDYHFFYNLVTAELIRVFHLPFFSTIFLGMYILAPILFGILAYLIATKIYPSKLFVRLFLFLIYFAGDAVGWVLLFMRHIFTWDVGSIINNAGKFIDGPPYAYGMILALTGLYLLLLHKDNLSKSLLVVLTLLFGVLIEFKIYVGVPILLGLGAFSAILLLRKKWSSILVFFSAGIVSVIFFKLYTSSSAGLFFLPFEIPRNFINLNIFNLLDWQLRWVIYQDHHNILRIVEYGFLMTGFYIIVQFGIQTFGIIPLKKTRTTLGSELLAFIYTVILSGCIFAFSFYQTVGGSNIWEFLLPVLFFLSLPLSLNIAVLLEKRPLILKTIFLIILVGVVIPRWILTVHFYITNEYLSSFHGVSFAELNSYKYISQNTPRNGIVLTINQIEYTQPVTVANLFMHRETYFTGVGVREIVTPEIKKRQSEVNAIATSTDSQEIKKILQTEKISYVYVYEQPLHPDAFQQAGLQKVFANDVATIYKVN